MDCKVNRDFLPVKLVYFTYLGAFACMLPYISVYFIHIGLSLWQVGVIRALEPALTFIFSPMWGAMADKYSKHKLATFLAITGAGIFYFLFLFVPLMTGVSPSDLVESSSTVCPTDFAFSDHNVACGNYSNEKLLLRTRDDLLDLSTYSNDDTCSELCSERTSQDHDNSKPTFELCVLQDENWNCDSCQNSDDFSISKDIMGNVTSVVYGFSCSKEYSPQNDTKTAKKNTVNVTPSSLLNDSLSSSLPNDVTSSPFLENNVNPTVQHAVDGDGIPCHQSVCCQCRREAVENPQQAATFAICTVLAIASVIFNCNILMFFDAFTMELLKDRRKDYGKNRLWGAISWALFGFLSGMAIDVYTKFMDSEIDLFEPAFAIYIVMMGVCLIVFSRMPMPEHHAPKAIGRNLRAVLCDLEVILFLLTVIVMGISFVLTFTYVFIFLKELHSSYLLVGLSVTLTAVAEIPFMFFSGTIIRRIGYRGVMYLALIAYAARYYGYSFLYNPWLILPIQLLHGITFGLAWPMFTAFANAKAPEGMAATLQSIVACSFMGIGSGMGNLLGGFIYYRYGARLLFRLTGTMCLVALVIFFLFTQLLLRREKKNKREDDNQNEEAKPAMENGKVEMKDVPIDAVKWDAEERMENGDVIDETNVSLTDAPKKDNSLNVDIHH